MTPTIEECNTYAECTQDNVSGLKFDLWRQFQNDFIIACLQSKEGKDYESI